MKPFAAIFVLVVLAGCGSSPATQFFTLDAVRPSAAPAQSAGVPVQVVAVHIPAALDRQEMVRAGAANTLAVSDQHRWSAPLGDLVQRVLTQDLAERLPKGMVVFPEEPAPPAVSELVVDILQFQRDADGNVTFDGSWSLLPSGSDTRNLSRHVHLSEHASGPNYGEQASAMSRILAHVADQVAASVLSANH